MRGKRSRALRRNLLRGAFFIIISLLLSFLFYLLRRLIQFTEAEKILLTFLETILVLLLPAWIGLSGKTGLHINSLHLTSMDQGKMVYLFLMGVFILFPIALINEVTNTLAKSIGITLVRIQMAGSDIFFPAMLLFVILRPLSAALFYDEYLSVAIQSNRKWVRLIVQISLCAIQNGPYRGFISASLIAMLSVFCFYQSSSIIAPILFFAGEGFGKIVLEYLQNSSLFSSHGLGICSLLIAGTIGELYWIRRAWQIPAGRQRIQLPERISFTGGERNIMICTVAAVVFAVIVAEVIG